MVNTCTFGEGNNKYIKRNLYVCMYVHMHACMYTQRKQSYLQMSSMVNTCMHMSIHTDRQTDRQTYVRSFVRTYVRASGVIKQKKKGIYRGRKKKKGLLNLQKSSMVEKV